MPAIHTQRKQRASDPRMCALSAFSHFCTGSRNFKPYQQLSLVHYLHYFCLLRRGMGRDRTGQLKAIAHGKSQICVISNLPVSCLLLVCRLIGEPVEKNVHYLQPLNSKHLSTCMPTHMFKNIDECAPGTNARI